MHEMGTNNEEEERKKAEERALRIEKLLEMMHAKDQELNSVISDKIRLVGELKEIIVKEDSQGTLKMPIISQHEIQMDQTRDIILAAMKEADLLTRSFYSGGNVRVSRSASSVGEPNLPEGPIPAEAIEKISENPVALEHVDAATQIHEHLNSLLKITVNRDTAFQTLKTQLHEVQHKVEAFSTSPTTTTSPSPKEKRRDSPPLIRMDPAGQDSRGSVNQGGVNITNDRVTEVAATEKAKANGEKPGRSSPSQSSSQSSVRTNNAQMRHSESSPRVNDHNLTKKAYGDIPSNNHLCISPEGEKSRDIGRKYFDQSPLLQDKMNAYDSSPKTSPRRTEEGDRTLTSSMSVIRRNVPHHLLSTTNQISTSGQVRQKGPLKLPNSQATTNSAAVQQMLPKKLETLAATSSKPNKNTNAQPQPTSDSDVIFF